MNLYLNADCMNPETGLPSYPDKYFDLAIVDPPYGLGSKLVTGGTWATGRKSEYSEWDNAPSAEYFNELFRVSANQIIWGGNYFSLPPNRCFIVWDKPQMRIPTMADCEYAWTSFDSVAKIASVLQEKGDDRIHLCQKPRDLYRWILRNYAKAGMRLLDTHVGSASSLVVYEEMGFEYVGYELDADYYRDSCKRLEAFRAQPKLFSGGEIFEASKPPTLF